MYLFGKPQIAVKGRWLAEREHEGITVKGSPRTATYWGSVSSFLVCQYQLYLLSILVVCSSSSLSLSWNPEQLSSVDGISSSAPIDRLFDSELLLSSS